MYNFLAVDVGVYLPAYEQVSIYFLKDIVGGKKNSKYLSALFEQLVDLHSILTLFI